MNTSRRTRNPLMELDRRDKRRDQIAYAVRCTATVIVILLLIGMISGQVSYFLNLDDAGWVLR